MTDEPSVLLTNDDGIDAPGIQVLADELVEVADVTVLAPVDDQSGIGRRRSWDDVSIEEREIGHAVDGTPVDCVVAGVVALDREFDVVVSGINAGHVLGRSGTVGAAIEAGFLGLPAIAVSMYDVAELPPEDPAFADFEVAVAATRFLLNALFDGGLGSVDGAVALDRSDGPDYLNVNAPAREPDPTMRLTHPSTAYELGGSVEADRVVFEDRFWDQLRSGDVDDPVGTDRRAVVDGEVSVSPLSAPKPTVDPAGQVIDAFRAGGNVSRL
jgi:5'-nucleotidase